MELARRARPKRLLIGLGKSIEYDFPLTSTDHRRRVELKQTGRRLFDPSTGGSYAVFSGRPLKKEVMEHCVQDVCILPIAWDTYSQKLNYTWRNLMLKETENRIAGAKSPTFNGKGQHMALAPTSWAFNMKGPLRTAMSTSIGLDKAAIDRYLRVMSGVDITNVKKPEAQADIKVQIEEIENLVERLAQQGLE